MSQRLAVLAGSGGLVPEALAAVRARDFEVQVLTLTPRSDLTGVAVQPADVSDLPGMATAITRFGATQVLMVGALQISDRTRETLARLGADGTQAARRSVGDVDLLSNFADALQRLTGAAVVGVHELAPGLLAPDGPIAGPELDEDRRADADFGLRSAREIGRLDLGQAVVVAGRRVVAAEDVGGTDALLMRIARYRALELIGDGDSHLVLAKAVKPGQPLFVDLPAIGPATIANAAQAGIGIVALEAGHTLLIDRAGIVTAAEAAGISVIGRAI